jgi:GNAT superfamily N-acetyltransferase
MAVAHEVALGEPSVAIEENLLALLAEWGRAQQGEVHDTPRYMRYLTGLPYPLYNGVARARFPAEWAAEAIAEALAPFHARHLPLMWWTGPATQPDDLGDRLEAYGLVRADEDAGMAMDLDDLGPPAALPEGAEIVRVEDDVALASWVRTMATGFGLPAAMAVAATEVFCCIGQLPTRHHYLATHNGRPVGTTLLYLGAGAAGLYWVSTVPQARRQGIASALAHRALADAREMGLKMAVLQATSAARGLYRRLGFDEYCTIGHYVWSASRLHLALGKLGLMLRAV